MPLGFNVQAVSVSGSDVPVASRVFNGIGPCRLYLTNSGGEALTACKVQIGPDTDHLYDFDATTFASLAAGATLSLRLLGPVDALKVLASCAAGTEIDAVLADEAVVAG